MTHPLTRRQLCAGVASLAVLPAAGVSASLPAPSPVHQQAPARPPAPAYPRVTASPELRAAYAAGLEALRALPESEAELQSTHDQIRETWLGSVIAPIVDFCVQARLHLGIRGDATTADLWRLVRLLGLEVEDWKRLGPYATVLTTPGRRPLLHFPAGLSEDEERKQLVWALSTALWGAEALGLGDLTPLVGIDAKAWRIRDHAQGYLGALAREVFTLSFVQDHRTTKKAAA